MERQVTPRRRQGGSSENLFSFYWHCTSLFNGDLANMTMKWLYLSSDGVSTPSAKVRPSAKWAKGEWGHVNDP
jgi:hypothetical protein